MAYEPLRAVSITDEDEWSHIKDLIKTTIKENQKSSALSITDLNYSDIEGIEVIDSKIFKLVDNMVEILSSNKKLFEDYTDVVFDSTPVEDINESNENGVSYKELYFKEIENRKQVEEDLKKATAVIEAFRDKVAEINKLLKED